MAKLFMVFDVESVGLHGEGFAVGWTVVDRAGREQGYGRAVANSAFSPGSRKAHEWVEANIPEDSRTTLRSDVTAATVRQQFWDAWLYWRGNGAVLVADCGWPVEARFLAACVDDRPTDREWTGPYPMHELASFLLAAGMDPLGRRDRKSSELPEHDPLADARQSARLLAEALSVLDAQPVFSGV